MRETSVQGTIIRKMIAHFTSGKRIGKKIKSGEFRKKMVEPPWTVPAAYHLEVIQMKEFSMERLVPKNLQSDKIILQLHGGGYIGAMRNAYRDFAVEYSKAGGGMQVLTIDYRVAPEHPYPAALEDAYAAYTWLLEQNFLPKQIVLAGDSAGGGLALALCMYIRNHGMEVPAGIIAMSPWADMTASGESYQSNYEKDPLFGKTKQSLIYNRDYLGMENPKNPYISPVFGEFDGFPPMLLQVGSYEMLLSDSKMVAQAAKQQGVRVRLSIYKGMFHVFQMGMQLMPESRKAWKEIAKFLEILSQQG